MNLTRRIATVLARMNLVSEGRTTREGFVSFGHSGKKGSTPPSGAFSKNRALADEWHDRFTRLCDAAELDLERARKGALPPMDAEDKTALIKTWLERREPTGLIAYTFGVSEEVVRNIQKQGKRAA